MSTPASALAQLHEAAFGDARAHGWGAAELTMVLKDPRHEVVQTSDAYAIAQVVLDEAELILIGTNPAKRGQGLGKQVLTQLHAQLVNRGVRRLFLEVAATNTAARALYAALGYDVIGTRRGYYSDANGPVDAILYEFADLGPV